MRVSTARLALCLVLAIATRLLRPALPASADFTRRRPSPQTEIHGLPTRVGVLRNTLGMANWSPLREMLLRVEDRRTFVWEELDALVGGLPRSAVVHPAFWNGARSGWPGFTTTEVVVGQSVTFVRRTADGVASPRRVRPPVEIAPDHGRDRRIDVVLVGCVKSKLSYAAPARDLYTSALFRKERAYAEAAHVPWFILSAEHGLVTPTDIVEPYDLRLSKTSAEYRRSWGTRVVDALKRKAAPLDGQRIEVHAGEAYADPIRTGLREAGARVVEPLRGLTMGQRLAWYNTETTPARPSSDVADVVAQIGTAANAQSLSDFLATHGVGLKVPGLYSWWVDEVGALELALGLQLNMEPGLIYAGLAGATRNRSARRSTNTLWGRVHGMHLGGRHDFSTFRLSLGSILAAARDEAEIDEKRLTVWMHEHLCIAALPAADADTLDDLESDVLAALDPPLNLAKMPKTAVRLRLSELRRRYGRTA